MPYNPNIHHRRSIRLKGYDYSKAGLYFITICVKERKHLFGQIKDGEMILNDAGKMTNDEWEKIAERFNNIQLHEHIVIPNHFHAILEIVGATLVVAPNNQAATNDIITQNNIIIPNNEINTKTHEIDIFNNDFANNAIPADNEIPDNRIPDNEPPNNGKGQPRGLAPTKTVGDMVGAFQSIATVKYIRGVKQLGWQPFNGKLWQRNYWEHIIRDEQSYHTISQYIINNPKKWNEDKFYES